MNAFFFSLCDKDEPSEVPISWELRVADNPILSSDICLSRDLGTIPKLPIISKLAWNFKNCDRKYKEFWELNSLKCFVGFVNSLRYIAIRCWFLGETMKIQYPIEMKNKISNFKFRPFLCVNNNYTHTVLVVKSSVATACNSCSCRRRFKNWPLDSGGAHVLSNNNDPTNVKTISSVSENKQPNIKPKQTSTIRINQIST